MTTCPKCQYQRQPQDHAPQWQCPACGVAYNKAEAADEADSIRAKRDAVRNAPAAHGNSHALLIVAAIGLLILLAVGAAVWSMTHRHRVPVSDTAGVDVASTSSAADASVSGSDHDFSLPGFQGLTWGVGDNAIQAKFGNALRRLNPPDQYSGAHADLIIEQYNLEGVSMRAAFQMSDASNGLYRVLLGKLQHQPGGQNYIGDYHRLQESMTRQLGQPQHSGEFAYSWIKGDTEIELDYMYQPMVLENLTVLYRPLRRN